MDKYFIIQTNINIIIIYDIHNYIFSKIIYSINHIFKVIIKIFFNFYY